MQSLELLAPAGDLDKLKYAFAYGADSVYAGLPSYSLRVKENKFTLESLGKGIKYAHKLGKKVYITVNFFPRYFNEKPFIETIKQIDKYKPDAYIISDPGVLDIFKEEFPNATLHLSVQANTTNARAVRFWHKQGISRVILARELSIEEIKEIHKRVPKMELEFFIHGSVCMAYSGRCFLSAYFAQRNPFQGVCAQPCRWKYKIKLIEEKDPDNEIIIEEDDKGSYLLSSKDLCLIKRLKELVNAGITSFKIEGRNKSEFYVSAVTKAYAYALNQLKKGNEIDYEKVMNVLKATSNRGFFESYLDKVKPSELQTINYSTSLQTYQYVGKVIEKISDNSYLVIPKNKICEGDEIEILLPNNRLEFEKAKVLNIRDLENKECVHGGKETPIIVTLNKIIGNDKFAIFLKVKNSNEENNRSYKSIS